VLRLMGMPAGEKVSGETGWLPGSGRRMPLRV